MSVQRLRFEVHGKVQGVFFRKHTKITADSFKLVGWCQNTPEGTVIGEAQGAKPHVDGFLNWLKTEGSPKSKVDKVDYVLLEPTLTLTEFVIDRSKDGRRFGSIHD